MSSTKQIVMTLALATILAFGGFMLAFRAMASPERDTIASPTQTARITPSGFVVPTPMPSPSGGSRYDRGPHFGNRGKLANRWWIGMEIYERCGSRWEPPGNGRDRRCDAWDMGTGARDACIGGLNRRRLSRPGLLPGSDDGIAPPEDVSFKKDVRPILNARCVVCHGGVAGLYLNSYNSILRGNMDGPVIVPYDPASSRLIQVVSSGYMPLGGPPLTQAQVRTLSSWVTAGAPNN